MAQIKYDVSDVETGGGGEEPQPALYPGNVVGLTHRTKKNDSTKISDIEAVVDIGEQYTRLWYYVRLPDDPQWDKAKHGWKLREFTDALGLPPKGGIDTTAAGLKKLYKPVNVKTKMRRDDPERAEIKNLFAPTSTTPASANGDGPAAEEGSDTGPYGREEIATWEDDDLKGYAEELSVDVPSGRGWKNKLIDALVVAEAEAAEGGDGDAESDGSAEDGELSDEITSELSPEAEHYKDWDDDDVKSFVADLGIDAPTSGRGWRAKAVTAITEFAVEYGGGGVSPDAEAEGDTDTYDDETEWPTADLKAEIDERKEQGAEIVIAGRATRQKMIDALRVDDKSAAPF